jgi:uncharacterized protein
MKKLVVSIHDVSPLTQTVTKSILTELNELGIGQTSLLVIPNHHHRAPVRHDSGFKEWLISAVEKGHEPVLHGYYHLRRGRPDDSWRSKIVTEFYTASEGEFFDLTEREARERLKNGLADLAFLSREISGFIAPAWLLGNEAEKAVRALGFKYTTRVATVNAFDKVIQSRSLVWSTRARWRVVSSLSWNGALAKLVRKADLVRVGIHPPDYSTPEIWRQIRKLLTEFKTDRTSVSYENFITQSTQTNPSPPP